jgi:hypothetical protein
MFHVYLLFLHTVSLYTVFILGLKNIHAVYFKFYERLDKEINWCALF